MGEMLSYFYFLALIPVIGAAVYWSLGKSLSLTTLVSLAYILALVSFFNQLIDLKELFYQLGSFYFITVTAGFFSNKERREKNDREGLVRTLNQNLEELSLLYEISKELMSTVDLAESLNLVTKNLKKVVKYDFCSVRLVDQQTGKVRSFFLEDLQEEVSRKTEIKEGKAVADWVVRNKKTLLLFNTEQSKLYQKLKGNPQVKSLLSLPVLSQSQVIGVLTVGAYEKARFQQEDVQILTILGSQITIVLKNALLYHSAREEAITDGLTQLYNYRYFQERLKKELDYCSVNSRSLSLLFLDVDYFKQYNDTYGHPQGDEVLRTISRIIKSNIRNTDVPVRYGGEEFAVILPDTNGPGAVQVAERIVQEVAQVKFPGSGENPWVTMTVSIGLALYPEEAANEEDLLARADHALYQAKKLGRNRLYSFSKLVVS